MVICFPPPRMEAGLLKKTQAPRGGILMAGLLACCWALPATAERTPETHSLANPDMTPLIQPTPLEPNEVLNFPDDRAFLDEWQRRCFLFFWEQSNPETGMTADRAPADGSRRVQDDGLPIGSIASVGFGLTAICIADERGWIASDAARTRVEKTLRFLLDTADQKEGFFYHFVDMTTGKRAWESEVSSIDTALVIAGVLTARQYYKGTVIEELATKLYDRVNWPWMMGDGTTLSMGWTPEEGFIPYRWDHFSEHLVLQIMGLGSNTHPLPSQTWDAWTRGPVREYEGKQFMSYPPLFVHQFSHAWVDFRGKRDNYADYWTNSIVATRAHRAMFAELNDRFPHYSNMLWGLTSSDSANGYTAWGGPDPSPHIDGTVVPCAAAGSIPFKPQECIAAVRHMYDAYGSKIWKRYGLADAFNPHTGWVAKDVIGIDVGITILMIENERSGFVWNQFMANPEIKRAMATASFRPLPENHPPDVALFFDRGAKPMHTPEPPAAHDDDTLLDGPMGMGTSDDGPLPDSEMVSR